MEKSNNPDGQLNYPPPPSSIYPPQGINYPPPPASGYPPPSGGYPPPPSSGYPPQFSTGYPTIAGSGYPPPGSGYPPQPNPLPLAQPYPPPQVYPPPNAAPYRNDVVIVSAAVNSHIHVIYGPMPVLAYCKHCDRNVNTRTEATIGCMVWLMFLIFYLVVPCISCIPFCVTGWYDVKHYCPNCTKKLGEFAMV